LRRPEIASNAGDVPFIDQGGAMSDDVSRRPRRRGLLIAVTVLAAAAVLLATLVLFLPHNRSRQAEPGAAPEITAAAPSTAPQVPAPSAAEKAPAAPSTPDVGGRPPGGAFRLDLASDPGDSRIWKSDHAVGADWIQSGFSPKNIAFSDDGMALSIRRGDSHGKPHSGAEAQIQGHYGYGRYQAILRAPKGDGLIGAFFTYTGPYYGDPHDEIDFEFLGKNPRQVQINHFVDGKSLGGAYIDLPFDASDGFHLYEFEWRPDAIIWSIDGREAYRVTAEKTPIPRTSAIVMTSIWSSPAESWVGPATYEDGANIVFRCISHAPAGVVAPQCSDP
jgi:beta-glucanase (GH16 family)